MLKTQPIPPATKSIAQRLANGIALAPAQLSGVGIAPVLFEEKRLAQSKELAEAIVLLAFDKASYITGGLLAVDGGRWRDKEEKFA